MENDITWQRIRAELDLNAILDFAAEKWDADADSFTLVTDGAHIVYRFEQHGGGCYLKFTHPMIHEAWKTAAAMDFLSHLAQNDAPVCHPVESSDGSLIETISQGQHTLQLTVTTEAPGAEVNPGTIDDRTLYLWGAALGKLHAASRMYTPSSGIQFPTIDRFWENVRADVESDDDEVQTLYQDLTDWFNALPRHDFGATHGDYRAANAMYDGSVVRTIDFDEPVYHFFISDVARVMLEFYERPTSEQITLRDTFLQGYLSANPIDQLWIDLLPTFMQHRALLMYLWTLDIDLSDPDDVTFRNEVRRWALNPVDWV